MASQVQSVGAEKGSWRAERRGKGNSGRDGPRTAPPCVTGDDNCWVRIWAKPRLGLVFLGLVVVLTENQVLYKIYPLK